jgi:hypothetical protein
MTTSFATSEKFWPLTFGERGVLVPFTTPMLAASRIRGPEIKKAEILVPGLSGGKGTYIIPWKSVPEMFKLTVHDRALHESICEAPDFSPRQIRMAALGTARLGLAGRDACAAARAHLQRDDSLQVTARFFLTLRVVERMATDGASLTLAELTSVAGQQKAHKILSSIAKTLGWDFDTLYDHLEVWSKTVAQIGLSEMPAEAPARRLINRLKPLGEHFTEWRKGETEDQVDSSADAQLAADFCRETWRLATEYATDIDLTVKQPAESLRNWDGTIRSAEKVVHKLLWILDGWEQVVKLWDQTVGRPREEQRSALRDVIRHLPIVPRDELPATSQDTWSGLVNSLRKQIKPVSGEGAATIGIDFDHMLRLEKLKGAPL